MVKPPRHRQEYVSAAQRTRCINVELKQPCVHMVEARRERLFGKSERNINADCRGHDFDRPRQVTAHLAMNTKPTLHHTTGSCFRCGIFRVWENCQEGLGVSSPMKGTAHLSSNEIVTRQKTVRHVHSTSNKWERSKISAENRSKHKTLHVDNF